MEKLLTLKQAGEYLGKSDSALRTMIRNGSIVFSLIGGRYMISEYDLRQYYENHKVRSISVPTPKKNKAVYIPQRLKPIRYNKKGEPVWV